LYSAKPEVEDAFHGVVITLATPSERFWQLCGHKVMETEPYTDPGSRQRNRYVLDRRAHVAPGGHRPLD
jgi:hypothetical protein